MAKMRKTFLDIGRRINEKRKLEEKRAVKKERGFRFAKTTLATAAAAGIICIGCYIFKDDIVRKQAPANRIIPKWNDVNSSSQEYADAVRLVDKAAGLMEQEGPAGLKGMWSSSTAEETVYECEDTLLLFKGGGLSVQSVREKADASKKFEVICKSPNNGHRLKISFRSENGILKLSGTDMIP